jgi:hypothetical protein
MIGRLPLASGAWEVAIHQDRAYVTTGVEDDDERFLEVVDIGDLRSPRKLGRLPISGVTRGLTALGDHVVLGVERTGEHGDAPRIDVVDVADGTRPRVVGSVPLEHPVSAIQVVEGFAFCSSRGRGLVVVDVRRRREPTVVAVVDHLGNRATTTLEAAAVRVRGRFAYLVADDELIAVELCGPAWRRNDLLT